MKLETKQQLKAFIEDFAKKMLSKAQDVSLSELRKAYPFHELFFRGDAIVAFTLQRSIVTAMGKKFYPTIAQMLASDTYHKVYLDHPISGYLDANTCNKIEQIVTDLRNRRRQPDHDGEVLEIQGSIGGDKRPTSVICDLYIEDFNGGPFFAEIKTPRPNLDICAESKKKILYFLAMMKSQGVSGAMGYLAFPYNPFLTRERYSHNFTRQVMDMDKEVLMGRELWDKIGGNGTYEELLEVIAEVRNHLPLI
ncbi:MAG: TdeIII family type II restriction endonuclease [Chloroflexi bacterium]|nr:TdeIII family type II restriction endonuclease [Chloroflexota bacterium]